MRKWLLLVWLMIPVLAGAYHYGPGQEQMVLDRAARILALADRCAADQQWLEAEQQYEQALQLLPADQIDQQRRVRLERSKAQLFIAKLPIAHRELKQLVDELQDDPETDSTLLDDARSTLANSQYYLTWLMRLEGQPRKAWEPEIEAAR